MPPTRVTLASNASQTTKTVLLLPPGADAFSSLLSSAKSKLRLKKPTRIFLQGGQELQDSSQIRAVLKDDIILLVSSGEEYVGNITSKRTDISEGGAVNSEAMDGGAVRLITNKANVDPLSVSQLEACARLPGIRHAVGLPDLHPGTKFPIGCTFVSENYIHPPLIGGDIGCGMGWYRVKIRAEKLSDAAGVRKVGEKLRSLEGEWFTQQDRVWWLGGEENSAGVEWDSSLGTIGAGNHFAEVQVVEEVSTYEYPSVAGGEKRTYTPPFVEGEVILLVHSGSRGFGQHALSKFYNATSPEDENNKISLHESDPRTAEYLALHDKACEWARHSRDLIALRFLEKLEGGEEWKYVRHPGEDEETLKNRVAELKKKLQERKVMDIHHNNVTKVSWPPLGSSSDSSVETKQVYIHRKGAAPSLPSTPLLPLPGSRGTPTLFLHPLFTVETEFGAKNALSLAHGAGRVMSRTKANSSLRGKYNNDVEVLTQMKKLSLSSSYPSGLKSKGIRNETGASDFVASGGLKGGKKGKGGSGGEKFGMGAGWVICDDKDLVWEEAPEAYKNVEMVAKDMVDAGVAVVVGKVRPRVTYKVRKE
ncbi:hypothetical protein RUND412_000297 [Rhizina undulata]